MYKIVDIAKQCLTIFSLLPKPNFASYVCEIKKSFIVWQNTAWKTFPMLFAQLVDMVTFTLSAHPEVWTDTTNSRTLSTLQVLWCNSQAAAHTVPSAKPRLDDGNLAPTEEHLYLQMVLEKSEGGRRIRLCNCSHLFPGDLHIKFRFFSLRSWQMHLKNIHRYFSANLSHGMEVFWVTE